MSSNIDNIIISGDTVNLNARFARGTFDNKNVGSGKTVTLSGLAFSGADAGNYMLNGYTTTADIIEASVRSVILTSEREIIYIGSSKKLNYIVTPSFALNQDVVWSSSDDSVASLDPNGRITANTSGTAVITITSDDSTNGIITDRVTIIVYSNLPGVDSDSDGVPDIEEEEKGSDPNDQKKTPSDKDGDGELDNPNADTDKDGAKDGEELAAGSNPDDASSKPNETDGDGNPDDQNGDVDVYKEEGNTRSLLIWVYIPLGVLVLGGGGSIITMFYRRNKKRHNS